MRTVGDHFFRANNSSNLHYDILTNSESRPGLIVYNDGEFISSDADRKKNGFEKLMCSGRNFVLELDSTCPFTIANLILFPSLLKEFDRITVVHSYVPIDVWVERIHERHLGGFKTSEYVDQVVSLYHQSAKK